MLLVKFKSFAVPHFSGLLFCNSERRKKHRPFGGKSLLYAALHSHFRSGTNSRKGQTYSLHDAMNVEKWTASRQ
jgi:hypothetical protein